MKKFFSCLLIFSLTAQSLPASLWAFPFFAQPAHSAQDLYPTSPFKQQALTLAFSFGTLKPLLRGALAGRRPVVNYALGMWPFMHPLYDGLADKIHPLLGYVIVPMVIEGGATLSLFLLFFAQSSSYWNFVGVAFLAAGWQFLHAVSLLDLFRDALLGRWRQAAQQFSLRDALYPNYFATSTVLFLLYSFWLIYPPGVWELALPFLIMGAADYFPYKDFMRIPHIREWLAVERYFYGKRLWVHTGELQGPAERIKELWRLVRGMEINKGEELAYSIKHFADTANGLRDWVGRYENRVPWNILPLQLQHLLYRWSLYEFEDPEFLRHLDTIEQSMEWLMESIYGFPRDYEENWVKLRVIRRIVHNTPDRTEFIRQTILTVDLAELTRHLSDLTELFLKPSLSLRDLASSPPWENLQTWATSGRGGLFQIAWALLPEYARFGIYELLLPSTDEALHLEKQIAYIFYGFHPLIRIAQSDDAPAETLIDPAAQAKSPPGPPEPELDLEGTDRVPTKESRREAWLQVGRALLDEREGAKVLEELKEPLEHLRQLIPVLIRPFLDASTSENYFTAVNVLTFWVRTHQGRWGKIPWKVIPEKLRAEFFTVGLRENLATGKLEDRIPEITPIFDFGRTKNETDSKDDPDVRPGGSGTYDLEDPSKPIITPDSKTIHRTRLLRSAA